MKCRVTLFLAVLLLCGCTETSGKQITTEDRRSGLLVREVVADLCASVWGAEKRLQANLVRDQKDEGG
jgi:uncharacterized lipoprotein YajG